MMLWQLGERLRLACWECGWVGPGVVLSCKQAPPGPVLNEMLAWQVFPFICIGCLGTVVAEWPGNIAAELAKRASEKR